MSRSWRKKKEEEEEIGRNVTSWRENDFRFIYLSRNFLRRRKNLGKLEALVEGQGELRSTRKSRRRNLNCPRQSFLFRLPSFLYVPRMFLARDKNPPLRIGRANFVNKNVAALSILKCYFMPRYFSIRNKEKEKKKNENVETNVDNFSNFTSSSLLFLSLS